MQPTTADRRRRSRETWGSAIGRRLRARERYSKARKDYRDLLRFDDRILKDIGITRDMVHHEMQKPFRWLG